MNHSVANRTRHLRLGAFTAVSFALVGVVACSTAAAPAAIVPVTPSPVPSEQPVESPAADPSVAPSPTAAPSGKPAPSQPAKPAEEPAEEPADGPFVPADFAPDRIGRVVATDGLRVRTLPTTGDESRAIEPTLDAGTRFYVVDGPVMADGYAWYQIDPFGDGPMLPFGWLAAGSRDGAAWIGRASSCLTAGEPRRTSSGHLSCLVTQPWASPVHQVMADGAHVEPAALDDPVR